MVGYAEPPVTAMSNVVNLGRARKRRREEADKRRADENAIRHGRTKAEKAQERMEQARLRATVDGARLEPGSATGGATDGPIEDGPEPDLGEPEA